MCNVYVTIYEGDKILLVLFIHGIFLFVSAIEETPTIVQLNSDKKKMKKNKLPSDVPQVIENTGTYSNQTTYVCSTNII